MTKTESNRIEASIARVQAGDKDAFRSIVDEMLPVVRSFVAARSLPGIDVDDVVQRTFVEVYQGIAGYRLGTSFQAWVVTIARYQLLMETTRLRRHADYHTRYVPVALAKANEINLQNDNADEDRLTHLVSCLEGISDVGRHLLEQRYRHGASISQISAELKRSEGAVRKQLCLIRQQLHACISRKLAVEQHHG